MQDNVILMKPIPAFFEWAQDNIDNVKDLLGKNALYKDIYDCLVFMWSRLDQNIKNTYIKKEQDNLKSYRNSLSKKIARL